MQELGRSRVGAGEWQEQGSSKAYSGYFSRAGARQQLEPVGGSRVGAKAGQEFLISAPSVRH